MGYKGKFLGLFLAAAMLGSGVARAEEQAIKPLTVNDIRVLLEQGIQMLSEKVKNSRNLSKEDRVTIARDIENQAEEMRERLDNVANDAIALGERTYPVGVIISYNAEAGFPAAFAPAAHYGPGAQAGLALFLKKNSYLSEAIRGSDVMILSAGLNVEKGRVLPGNRSTERGIELKILFANNTDATNLSAFEGFFTGIGAKLSLFGGRDLGEIYTKPQTCTNMNPMNCSVYIWRVAGLRSNKVKGEIKEIYINFPHSNDKRGYHF